MVLGPINDEESPNWHAQVAYRTCRPTNENADHVDGDEVGSGLAIASPTIDDGTLLTTSNVEQRPGAYHIVPRTTLTRHSGSEAANTTGHVDPAAADLPIVITATLVEDGGDDDAQPLSSTLVTHATSSDNSDGAPALSLVDQRVVDKKISDLEGAHKKRFLLGAALVLLTTAIAVGVAVPLTRPTAVPTSTLDMEPLPPPTAAPTQEPKSDWHVCSTSAECRVWIDGTGCCTGKYSNGVSKCTPLSPWFNQRTNECIVGVVTAAPTTPTPDSADKSKSDWSVCSTSTECRVWADGTGCCTDKYSDGVLKCTPLSPGFNQRKHECIVDVVTAAPTPTPDSTDGDMSKSDWSVCSSSAECRVWAVGTGCCTDKYSDGVSKCTPLSRGFNETTNNCIVANIERLDVTPLPLEPCNDIIVQKLERRNAPASGGNPNEFFGKWSATSGSTAVVGSPGYEGIGLGGKVHKLGRVHVFEGRRLYEKDGAIAEWVWKEESSPLEPAERETKYGVVESFGFRVAMAMAGDILAVTAFSDSFGVRRMGMVYVYHRDSDTNTWQEEAVLLPPPDVQKDDAAVATFGTLVAVSGDTIAVTSPKRDNGKGAVHVFSRTVDVNDGAMVWAEQAKLESSDGVEGDEFGSALAIDGDTVVSSSVLARDEVGRIVGKAYVFSKDTKGEWVEKEVLTASDASPNSDFGFSVAIYNKTIAVGAPFARASSDEEPSGSVCVYECDGVGSTGSTMCDETAKLVASDASEFGGSLAMYGNVIAVGAPSTPTPSPTATQSTPVGGGVYVYVGNGDSWTAQTKFRYPGTESFGRSIGISKTALVATDPVYKGIHKSGAAFVVDYMQSNQTLC